MFYHGGLRCRACGTKNPPVKKTCANCGTMLEGRTVNNVTGKWGYRHADGSFTPDADAVRAARQEGE